MFLTIDQGTTSSKAILFDINGQKIDVSQKVFKQIFPRDGWVEHDPFDILHSVIQCCEDILSRNLEKNINSLAITNQRETVIVWDKKNGKPIYNAIVWQDRRTQEYCNKIKEKGLENIIRDKTGLLLDPYFSASKINWIIKNNENIKNKIKKGEICVGTVDSWLIYNLTNKKVFATDITNASRTSLYNINSLEWDDELLEIFDIPKNIMPEVRDSDGYYGKTEILSRNLEIYGVVGDQQSAAIGQKCFREGDIKSTYGTGCFVLANTGETIVKSDNGLITTVASKIQGQVSYAIEGSIFMAGAIVDWVKDYLQLFDKYAEIIPLIDEAFDSSDSNVVLVPAFTGLGAPHWSPKSRAAIFGMNRDTGRKEIIHAGIQSVSLQTNDLLRAISKDLKKYDITLPKNLKIDGGMVENQLFVQNLANICNLEILCSSNKEATALGATILSGLGSNKYKNINDLDNVINKGQSFQNKMEVTARESIIAKWDLAVKQTIGMV